jgi:hypothetical protein
MECVAIRSRLINSAAYYPESKKLCVWFRTGRCAWHDDVSATLFRNLVDADSPGFYYKNYLARAAAPQRANPGRLMRLAAMLAITTLVIGVSGILPLSVQPQMVAAASDR